MKLLFDVGHPSFVYLFKNCASYFIQKGDDVRFTARDKDLTIDLLEAFNFSYLDMGKTAGSLVGKVISLFKFDLRLLKEVNRFKPDVILSGASPYAAHVAALKGIPHYLFDDTENKEQLLLYKYFRKTVLTPESFASNAGKRHLHYPGFHELAYLHPNWFKFEEKAESVLGRPLILVRFISHHASHDTFLHVLNNEQKVQLISALSVLGEVQISSEITLPEELKAYAYRGEVQNIHAQIKKSDLVVGESATMAAEAAMLGVPAIFFDDNGRCYIRDLEKKYGLVTSYTSNDADLKKGIRKAKELLQTEKQQFIQAQKKLLQSNMDLSAFIIWMLENSDAFNKMKMDEVKDKMKEFVNA